MDAKWLALFSLIKECAILYIRWCEEYIFCTPPERSALSNRREKVGYFKSKVIT